MNETFSAWWQALVVISTPVVPYVGLILFLLLGLLLLFLLLYGMYKLAKRLPPILRYSSWRVGTVIKRLLTRKPQKLAQRVTAVFAGDHQVIAIDESFDKRLGLLGGQLRPSMPLFVVLGSAGSDTSSLLDLASGRSHLDTRHDLNAVQADVVWWQLKGRLALEIHPRLHAPSAYAQRVQLLYWIERFSPGQPLDGIIVTLSVDILLDKSEEQRNELVQLGQVVKEFCALVENRLQVYVVISGCDRLTGFSEFIDATGSRSPENELNWLGEGSAAAPDIEEILAVWCQSVETKVLRSLVTSPWRDAMSDNHLMLALPTQVRRLQLPLLEWLKGITTIGTSDQGTAVFCGVLLTGLTQPAENGVKASAWSLGALGYNLGFAKALVSLPVTRYVLRMRRLVGLATAVWIGSLLLFAVWIPRTWLSIQENVEMLRVVVTNTRNFQLELAATGGSRPSAEDPYRLDHLLEAIAVTSKSSLWAALVPTSWFDGSRSEMLTVLGTSTQKLLIEPRVEALARDQPSLPSEAFVAIRAVAAERINGLPAYGVLHDFLSSRELVGSAKDTAESLTGGVSYQDVVRFVGDDPERFRTPAWDPQLTLPVEVIRRFDISGLRRGAPADQSLKSLVDALWERVLQESLDLHPAVVLVQEINALTDRLGRDSIWSYEDAVSLGDCLRRLQLEVERPQAQRLLGTMPDALRFFSPVFVRLSNSSIVSAPQRTDFSVEFGKRRDAVRSRLLSFEPHGIGRVFVLDPANDRLKLSVEVKRFSASYALLMAQPFMKPVVVTSATQAQADRVLMWNLGQLESVKELSAAMRDYASVGVQSFDPVLRSNLLRVARYQFRRTVDGLVLHAARSLEQNDRGTTYGESLMELREQAENIVAATRLYKLAVSADEGTFGFGGEMLSSQLLRVLKNLESRLTSESPYGSLVSDTQRWVLSSPDDRPLASMIRGSPKERTMLARDYVRMQYGTVAGLLLQALNGLTPGDAREEVVQRWRRLTDTLDAFDKGASANGLYELEQYILNLAKLGAPDECVRFLEERAPVLWRSDYFSTHLAQLDEKVVEACAQRMVNSQQKKYSIFVSWFNAQIAGHPPFAGERLLTALSRRSFAAVLDRYRDMRKQLLVTPPGWPQPVAQFLAQMDNLSTRFASMDTGKAAVGGAVTPISIGAVQAKLQFRTNQTEAVLADQIIDWSIVAGSRKYGLRNTKDLFEWRIGEPMEVRLRWAANSPYTPVASKNGNDLYTVSDRSAVFSFSGEWSFFDLMHRHSVQGDGFEKAALRFDVPVVGPEGRETAHVFLTLTAPNDQMSLALKFPDQAPLLVAPSDFSTASSKPLNFRP